MLFNITTMLNYDFMRHAFAAGTLAAIVAGIVGYFVVLRNISFAGHALSHISFAGATGASLIGLTPMTGQLLLTLLAAIGMGLLGENIHKRDTIIGIILAFSLGLGVLFLYFYKGYAGQATAILFGDILGVSTSLLKSMCYFSLLSLLMLSIIGKRLLFASLEPELAEAKGISLKALSVIFLLIVAIAVAQASQVVGILLVFTLLIGPAATAINCTKSVYYGILLTISLAISTVWLGIILTYLTNWPTTFWISSLCLMTYLLSLLFISLKN